MVNRKHKNCTIIMPELNNTSLSPYDNFSRDEWAALRATTPLTLTATDLEKLRGLNEHVDLNEVAQIYLPLSRLLNLYVTASQELYQVTDRFLGHHSAKVPYIIGIAGSVAVGKSTTARIMKALLERWPGHPRVDLVTTDGFLYPNEILRARNLMHRKGFPESYQLRMLIKFVMDVKSGVRSVNAPIYSHLSYNIMPGQYQTVDQPDVLIIEGLNILQSGTGLANPSPVFVSDFFDFSIYVDADEENLREWYITRFMRLRETAFQNEASYFHSYTLLSEQEALRTGTQIWDSINGLNLRENIAPTRERAKLILEKGKNHLVQRIRLRKL